ncbi:haloacid dehalogenase superfamily, subfamily IA, variant 3 with third motif having DD or ED/haloacid dehalogenase superfamily, subfamily IA, variant 1 with third motif having Dx(3-4)D or Dx(3-4)E [Anaerorhabdus furcosa]|uniref:Haloacid dehalogenase superfamily, subfamily IA, variant 3 with third motif having DD or ED/haloacid dehalogenase superfamily, subfamily IA, variant 1 with third motif having Dx(3-4)D or Dx(3-4)E n=2 Tax=Anaerorhabdus furcosa TaxID=118967 RepID=A0A1T4K7B1_9FIRM|nr:haloacid dehalogenase superfamily, subfamily IA, variant 3 with third motif having DD or ED/haloacid dehalogenase superfamily, subfamily IA, variant 1 with third motif having Dx(3-4)D or Dx(3-4)E [Anaerorhabdus furcosa]
MDGVIIDSEPVYIHKQEIFMAIKNYEYDKSLLIELVGKTRKDAFKLLSNHIVNFYTDEETYLEDYKEFWIDFDVNYKRIENEGIRALIQYLKSKNMKIGLASSSTKETISKVLDTIELKSYFDVIVSGEDFVESKPNPEIYQDTLKKLGLNQGNCIVIEDSTVGIQAAKNAGLFVIAKEDKRFNFDQSKADFSIIDFKQLKDMFLEE